MRTQVIALIICVTLAGSGCSIEQSLSFQRISDNFTFRTKGTYSTLEPKLVIIATEDEVTPPEPDLQFVSIASRNGIAQTDFQRSFVVLMRHGKSPTSARIKSVFRQGDTVFLFCSDDSIAGNYVSEGYTFPYDVIAVSKEGAWRKTIHFVLKSETNGIQAEISHYVP
jgi:hypothetical protein